MKEHLTSDPHYTDITGIYLYIPSQHSTISQARSVWPEYNIPGQAQICVVCCYGNPTVSRHALPSLISTSTLPSPSLGMLAPDWWSHLIHAAV